MADTFEQFEMLLKEMVNPAVVHLEIDEGDVAWDLTEAFQPISTAGRDTNAAVGDGAVGYFAEWRVRQQRSGLITAGTYGASVDNIGANNTLPIAQANDNLYPDPVNAPMRGYLKIRMALKLIQGVITLNRNQIESDLAAQPIEDIAAGQVEDITFQARSYIEAHLYGDGGAMVARVNNAANIVISEGSNTEVPIKEGTYRRFVIGQRYVTGSHVTFSNFGSSARTVRGGSAAVPAVMRCVDVDTDARSVFFEPEPGVGNITVQDGDDIMVEGTYDFTAANVTAGANVIEGFESLLISSGLFPGAFYGTTQLNADDHKFLKSFIQGTEGVEVAPTPEVIAELIDKMTDAGKTPPSVVIAESSLWTLYSQLEKQAYATYPVPQGAAFQASGQVAGPRIGHGSVSFQQLRSAKIRPGSILGLTPSVWKKFIPLGDKTIKWALTGGGVSGAPSIFAPVTEGRQIGRLSQAPFDMHFQIGCTDPQRNLRRIGLHSQRTMGGT